MILILLLSELGKGTISVTDIFEYYKQRVIKAFESIMRSPFVEGFIKFFINAWNIIKTFWNNIVNFFTNLGDNISNFYETYFGDLDFDIKDFGLFGVLAAIGVLLYKFTRDVEGWASIGSRIADVLNAFANKVNSESLLNIAKAVGILAASILVLSLIPYQTLLDTVSMVSVVMVMFMGLFTVIKKTFDALEAVKNSIEPIEKMGLNLSKGIQRFVQRAGTALVLEALGDALIKIAIAIVGLGLAFQFMPDAMENAIKTIAGVAAVLILLSVAIAILINSSSLKGIKGLTKIGDAINLGLSSLFDGLGQFLKIVAIAIVVEAFADAVLKVLDPITKFIADTKLLETAVTLLLAPLKGTTLILEKVGEALDFAQKKIQPLIDGFNKLVASLKNSKIAQLMGLDDVITEIEEVKNLEEQIAIQREFNAKNERKVIEYNAKEEKKAADLREKAFDTEKYNAKERKKYIQEYHKHQQQIIKNNLTLAKQQLNLAELEAKKSGNTAETNKQLAQQRAEVVKLQAALSNDATQMEKELKKINSEITKKDKSS
jgi:hypothetical protein